jgi:hypothetical protein
MRVPGVFLCTGTLLVKHRERIADVGGKLMDTFDLAQQTIRDRSVATNSLTANNQATWRNLQEAQQLESRLVTIHSRLFSGKRHREAMGDARERVVVASMSRQTPPDAA